MTLWLYGIIIFVFLRRLQCLHHKYPRPEAPWFAANFWNPPQYYWLKLELGDLYYEHFPLAKIKNYYYQGDKLDDEEFTIPEPWEKSPDFRLPELPYTVQEADSLHPHPKVNWKEHNRPYLIFPTAFQLHKDSGQSSTWIKYAPYEHPEHMACYCCTAYKRLTPLAGCAVITKKHILTTATSTELVLRRHPKKNQLENILGAWYHISDPCDGRQNNERNKVQNCYNSSTYASPSRIHYHPRWVPPDRTNRSHPLPSTMDLALWATTYPMHDLVMICPRGHSYTKYAAPQIIMGKLYYIVGYQFVWDIKRKPMPWFMYAVKVRHYETSSTVLKYYPCPKTEWGWFVCVQSRSWAQLGLDSGAALHYTDESLERDLWSNLASGFIGLNVFSMKLRSKEMVHYFQPVDTHSVLDWLYSAYNGRLIYRWLDGRFNDTQFGTPKPKPWARIIWAYIWSHDGMWQPSKVDDQNLPPF